MQYPKTVTGVGATIGELAESDVTNSAYQGQINLGGSKPDGTPKKQLNVNKLKALGWSSTISIK